MDSELKFDVLLSFAGSERVYARAIYDICIANNISTFLDEEFQHEIWGKNLVEYLDQMYRERGLYCVALISREYCERAYTKVERRAAYDRMISEQNEYFLPVKVDDFWPKGLSNSTTYLDLRIHGVIGICETLLRKLYGSQKKLYIPDSVLIPRIPTGQLKAEHLLKYLKEFCLKQPVSLFGILVYDEHSAELRNMLLDTNYWDALDKASGSDFEIFAIRDTKESRCENFTMEMITLSTMNRSQNKEYYFSKLLKEYFDIDKATIAYPSLLLFVISNGSVSFCRLIPLKRGSVDQVFLQLQKIVLLVGEIIREWKQCEKEDVQQLLKKLKEKLLDEDYTLYILESPLKADDAISNLLPYIE